jgi:hypothetical protein
VVNNVAPKGTNLQKKNNKVAKKSRFNVVTNNTMFGVPKAKETPKPQLKPRMFPSFGIPNAPTKPSVAGQKKGRFEISNNKANKVNRRLVFEEVPKKIGRFSVI